MLKLVYPCRRLPALDRAEYGRRILEGHVPLALRHHPGMRHYVVNLVERDAAGQPEVDSFAELWFESEASYEAELYDSDEGRRIIGEDVALPGRRRAVRDARVRAPRRPAPPARRFNCRIGKMREGEAERFLDGPARTGRQEPAGGIDAGFSDEEARREAARCLHCDCRKAEACRLRDACEEYGAVQSRYAGDRKPFEQQRDHPDVLYEPGKCIDCGICVRITSEAQEELGLTFVGRGFDVRVAVPFDRSLADGLKAVAHECVRACPTGALALRDTP